MNVMDTDSLVFTAVETMGANENEATESVEEEDTLEGVGGDSVTLAILKRLPGETSYPKIDYAAESIFTNHEVVLRIWT